jgi:hypothetical protein
MFKYKRVQINRSETTTITKDVAPWEVAVLAAVNGGDRIIEIGETPVNRALPDAGMEYDRLVTKYKADPNTGIEYVASAYGAGRRGVESLAKEIERARLSAHTPAFQTSEYDANDDPLTGLFGDSPRAGATAGVVEIAE